MKRKVFVWVMSMALCVGLFILVRDYWQPKADPMQKRFVAAKHAEAKRLAQNNTNPVPSQVWSFFRAAERNDYRSATLIYDKLAESEYAPRANRSVTEKYWADFKEMVGIPGKEKSELDGLSLATPMWETKEALHHFRSPKSEWMRRLGEEIVATVSTNGIFLSGTDAGHVTALCVNESSSNPKPFTTISVARMADGGYLEYLRQTCGEKLLIPTPQEAQNAFADYMKEAQRRMQTGP